MLIRWMWPRRGPPRLNQSCDSASRLRLHTQKIIKNDRCGIVRLSKIAHIRTIAVAMPGPIKPRGRSSWEGLAMRPTGGMEKYRSHESDA